MASIKFFVLIKPDGLQRGLVGEIISRFEKRNFILHDMKMLVPSEKLVREHYKEHEDKTYFEDLVKFISPGYVIPIIFEGNIQVARNIIGNVVPWKAKKGTIRGDYACSMPSNLIHCSHSEESARREIALWFD